MIKSNIIVLIPLVWSYRNFIITRICLELEANYNIFYAIPEIALDSFLESGINRSNLILLNNKKRNWFQT